MTKGRKNRNLVIGCPENLYGSRLLKISKNNFINMCQGYGISPVGAVNLPAERLDAVTANGIRAYGVILPLGCRCRANGKIEAKYARAMAVRADLKMMDIRVCSHY
jgi:hypothetical protein